MNSNVLAVIIVAIIVFIIFIVLFFRQSDFKVSECVENVCFKVTSDYPDYKDAAQILAHLNKMNLRLIDYLQNKYKYGPHYLKVKLLTSSYNQNVLVENPPINSNTSYVENKGKLIAYCLRDKKNNSLHDIHTLEFVALHEISHLTLKDYKHPKEFWDNFKWILEEAKEAGIHQPQDYSKYPVNYCGLFINYNPYFSKESNEIKRDTYI